MKSLIMILSIGLIFAACSESDEFLPPELNYEIPQTNITQNVLVGTYYFNYVPADWAKKYTNTPQLGEYSALTADVMQQHRSWADAGGIDFFIFPWNGTSGNPLLTSFITGRNGNVKMVINYSTAHLSATNASPLTGTKLTNMINEFKTHGTTHFDKDYYFKIDGKPVVIINPINLSSNALTSIDYPMVISTLRTEMKNAGFEPFLIGEITSGWLPPQRYSSALKAFDAVVLSNWTANGNYGYDRSVFYPAFSDQAFKNWADSTTVWGINFVPCIMPGFNDKTMTPASKNFNIDRNAKLYTDLCNVAKRNMGNKRIVTINSWNNFQLGTTIEPATEYGTEYLSITKSQFKIN